MTLVYRHLIPLMWASWALYWWGASWATKISVRQESWLSRLSHVGPLTLAVLLLWLPHTPLPLLETRVLPYARSVFWTGVAVIAAGLLFTVWARVHLGRNWSGTIAIKESHDLITTGPYSLVRHPIYSGLLLGFLGSAIARAEWRGVLAVAIVTSALWRKLRIEESWLAREFGEAYATYRHRVATLVPFVL